MSLPVEKYKDLFPELAMLTNTWHMQGRGRKSHSENDKGIGMEC
jgi:hypothetical protein